MDAIVCTTERIAEMSVELEKDDRLLFLNVSLTGHSNGPIQTVTFSKTMWNGECTKYHSFTSTC